MQPRQPALACKARTLTDKGDARDATTGPPAGGVNRAGLDAIMTEEQVEQLRFALSRPRYSAWTAPPLVPGEWRDLTGEEALTTVLSISGWLGTNTRNRNIAIDWSIDRARVCDLACYDTVLLVEMQGHAGYGRPGLINVMIDTDSIVLMDGASAGIHGLNTRNKLLLDTAPRRMAYLHLFMNWVHGSDGRFQPMVSQESFAARLLPDSEAGEAAELVQPITEEAPPEDAAPGTTSHAVTVLYGTSLFRALLHLDPEGLVEMKDDEKMLHDLPIRKESMVGPLMIQHA